MILPVYAYGQPVLKQRAIDVDPAAAEIQQLIADMWETMYHASGVGLAAPQIGKSYRIFLVDTEQLKGDDEEPTVVKGIKKAFLNAEILEEEGKDWPYITISVLRPLICAVP